MIADVNSFLSTVKMTCRNELIENLDYWYEHGVDWEKGGLITYLDRYGNRWDDKKSGWFQGRTLFAFCRGYNDIEKKQTWLDAAHNLYKFLCEHNYVEGDPHGKMVYTMDRDGNCINIHPDIHSEAFCLMGLSEYYKSTGNVESLEHARRLFDDTLMFYFDNPLYLKTGELAEPGKRDVFPEIAWYMSLLCSTQTARDCDPDPERKALYTKRLTQYVEEVFDQYYDEEMGTLMEHKIQEMPGHTCEVIWFSMAEAMYQGRQDWMDKLAKCAKNLFEYSYDYVNGGMPLLKNFHGLRPVSIGWDVRYRWVHDELLLTLIYAYAGTKDMWFLERYRMVLEYFQAHFPDRQYGEHYAYLRIDGTPILDLKGDDMKGPYHFPRHMIAVHNLLAAMGY